MSSVMGQTTFIVVWPVWLMHEVPSLVHALISNPIPVHAHCKNMRIILTQFGYLSCNSRATSYAGIPSGQLSLVSYKGNYTVS